MKSCLWILSVCVFCAATAFAQQSKKSFDAPLVVAGSKFRIDDLADLDADGDLDCIGWFWTSSDRDKIRIAVMQNDNGRLYDYNNFSHYQFVGHVDGSPATMWDSVVGNVDTDATTEYVLVVGKKLMVVGRDPSQSWLIASFIRFVNDAFTSVALADYDNDGDLDIVASDLANLRFYLNDGTGVFVDGPVIPIAGTLRIITGDVTLDGVDDVIALFANEVKVYTVVSGTPTLDASITHGIAQDPQAPIKPSLGDVDGDGDLDVVIFNHESNYAVLRNDGAGNLVASSVLVGGPAEKLVDIDGDGDLDGVCCGGGGGIGGGGGVAIENTQSSTFMIAHNDGTGIFTNSVTMPGLGADRLAGAVDIENDGDIDLIAGRCVYYADGPLIEPVVGIGPLGGFGLQGPTDIDGDFDADFLGNINTARLNLANGTFVDSPMSIQAPSGFVFDHVLCHGDFDNDGHIDFLCQKLDAGTLSFVDMHLIQGNGNGLYVDAGPCTAAGTMFTDSLGLPVNPKWSLAADVNNDGNIDFVGGTENNVGASLVWVNDGNGFFTAGSSAGPVAQVVDLDGDGLNDIIGQDASVRWGKSDGTWFAGQGAGPWPSLTIQVVDYESDGLLNLPRFS
ncbi:MAG: hypothetical protein ACI97A_002897 [Planctomycetota bacterium]|jgi:hypothetical protein